MRIVARRVSHFAILLIALASAVASRPVLALEWLALLIDRSHSISVREFALQHDAYVRLLRDPEIVRMLGKAQVAIIEFDTIPELVVGWTTPEQAARAYDLHARPAEHRLTGVGNAIAAALALVEGKPGRSIIDISGDGRDNVDFAMLRRAREIALDRQVEINGLVMLSPEAWRVDEYYDAHVVTGFVLTVDKPKDFADALRRKLVLEIARASPNPGGLNSGQRKRT